MHFWRLEGGGEISNIKYLYCRFLYYKKGQSLQHMLGVDMKQGGLMCVNLGIIFLDGRPCLHIMYVDGVA